MKKHLSFFIALFLMLGVQYAIAQPKQNISVLYVGGSAEFEIMGNMPVDNLALEKSVQARTRSFTKFLKSKFRTVKAIDAKEYTAEMSDQYDVTIFDGKPLPIRPEINERDEKGRTIRFEKAAYLPDDFNRPALCIANASQDMGRSIGTKCDWFCLCLFADAHNWKKDHPIFQGPFKVNIKSEMKPTPSHAYEYAQIYGYTLPDKTEMWTVQNTSDIPSYRIGMVSRPEGFLDSPETEIISSGHCGKSIDAVAIGRHTNFFHWGFSASPAYMTEAGKAAFANAVVYISKFAGQHIIARKLNEQIATRREVDKNIYLTSQKAVADANRNSLQSYQMIDSIKRVAIKKQERGETLTPQEKGSLNYRAKKPKEIKFEDFVKGRYAELYRVFGNDEAEYKRYFEKNKGWFYPTPSGYTLAIDEDVRSLGIANNDIRLLDTCISLLERSEETELATRVLHRYTLCRFATPTEWRNWFETYKEKMFFTESGGWLWLINTQDRNVPGNDYNVLKSKEVSPKQKSASIVETDEKNPVALSASIQTVANGMKEVVIRMKMHTGYHTYAQIAKEDPFIPTTFKWELPDGYSLKGDMKLPAFSKMGGSATTIYKDEAVFRQPISGTGNGEIKCTVGYQCCDDNICFPPTEKVLSIKVQN